jgi:serine kinase of HPr protein (carbohydrate metabolism regulator)
MLLHATCIAIDKQAVLLTGAPGSGKSDLALRLIDTGAILVADDQVLLHRTGDIIMATPPATLAGLMEIRHIGLMHMPYTAPAPVALLVELPGLHDNLERLPTPDPIFLLDHPVPRLRLPSFAASTPAKIRAFLKHKRMDD